MFIINGVFTFKLLKLVKPSFRPLIIFCIFLKKLNFESFFLNNCENKRIKAKKHKIINKVLLEFSFELVPKTSSKNEDISANL